MKPIKQFELKQCNDCGTEYKHYAVKQVQLCKECTTKYNLAKHRLKPDEYKKNYPLSKNEQKKRYTRLRRGLDKCLTREDKTRFYDEVLKEMHETGIYLWCIDLRMPIKPIEKGRGKAGRNPMNKTEPKLKWPDTRQMHE
jgi:hypothetical protein